MAVDFGRVLTAMVTPMNEDASINTAQVGKLAKHLVESGSDGLVVAGTTGESPTLTWEEKIELFRVVAEGVGGKATVIAGTGNYSTAESIELTREAEKAGADGIMLVAPYYNKPSQEGLFQHFKKIAESTDLPVMIYNIPGRTSVNILPETLARLAEVDNIVAVKEASGDLNQVSEVVRLTPDDFLVYSGDDSLTMPIMAVGGRGVVSVASHLAGERIKEMVDAFVTGNTTRAAELHIKLMPLFKGMFITTNPVPVKAALNLLGWNVGQPRLPLVDVNEEEKERLKEILKEQNLL